MNDLTERRRPRYRIWRRLAGAGLAVALLVTGTGGIVAWREYESIATDLPTVDGLRHYDPPVMSRIYAGDGRVIAELAAERRIFAPYASIPDRVKNAFIAAEDQNFYSHGGVDPLAILRAAVTDIGQMGSGRRPIGASTITQQVAKIMLLNSSVNSFKRKAEEALLAMRIEQTLPKDRILEIYLNELYLGAGAYGVAAAARTYFDKPLDRIDAAEAAFLASLPKSPTNYNPYRFPAAATARRNWVLGRMVDTGAITEAAATAAMAEPLVPKAYQRPGPVPGSQWFSEEVRRELIDRYGKDVSTEGGLVVQTSLNAAMQADATRALRDGLMRYDRSHGFWRGPVAHIDGLAPRPRRPRLHQFGVAAAAPVDWPGKLAAIAHPDGMLENWRLAVVLSGPAGRIGWLGDGGGTMLATLREADLRWAAARRAPKIHPIRTGDVVMIAPPTKAGDPAELRQVPEVEGALVAMDPHSGRVLAMVGGWSFEESQFNRATQALRQPGSSFKPIVYLAAMEQGISPAEKFLDAPFVKGNWRPNNYELDYNGPTSLHDALRNSLNLVTIRLAAHIGMPAVAKVAIALHEYDSMPEVLPAALGAVDTTVLREAGAYACIADGGRDVQPSLIDTVQNRNGQVIWQPQGFSLLPAAGPALPPALADQRQQVADPDSTYQVERMMQDVIARGTGQPAGVGIERPIAGKTGTSQDFNDAWFAGFSADLLTVVWVGFDTPRSLGDKETGGKVAGPIWNQFMKSALAGKPVVDFRVPPDMTLMRYNTGQGEAIDGFKPGQQPGLAGMVASDNNGELGPDDTGAENVPDSETQMASMPGVLGPPGLSSSTSVDAPPPTAKAQGTAQPAAHPAARPAAGGDIGMGGLY
ncbi:penicillin-binding protein 1A [Lichenicoccus sp.]|uniref:penicillin-binding protein 1A n=1 Tax=Lichenicoccus sp. TaxID=2781899 RepID=UPI003D11CFAB